MEKMKAGINAMGTEVNSCWKEIDTLQDAMKELEDGRTACTRYGTSI